MPAPVCSEFFVHKQINYNGSGPDVINSVFANDIEVTGNVIVGTDIYAVGNVRGRYLSGNGCLITGIVATSVPSTVVADVVGNVTATFVNATANIKTNGTVIATKLTGTLAGNVTGNVTATFVNATANIRTTGNVLATNLFGNLVGNVTAAYVNASGNINTTATLFAGNIAFNNVVTIVDDPAAATAGIPVGGIYANVGVLQVRRA